MLNWCKVAALLLLLLQSCSSVRLVKQLNCAKNGKQGQWFEVDSIGSVIRYEYVRYKNNQRHGRYVSYVSYKGPADWDCHGVMYKEDSGWYRHGRKSGLWLLYINGYFLNWVFYSQGRSYHDALINSKYMLMPCLCENSRVKQP